MASVGALAAGKPEATLNDVSYLILHLLMFSVIFFFLLLSFSTNISRPDSPIVAASLSLGSHDGTCSSLGVSTPPSARELRHWDWRAVRERPAALMRVGSG